MFAAYVENDTPGAWRLWFWYGPEKDHITVVAIGPHPDELFTLTHDAAGRSALVAP